MVFLLPFDTDIVPIGIGLYAISNLFTISLKERYELLKKRKVVFFSIISFYLVHLLGMIYSSNQGFGWFDMEVKLSLLLVPMLMLTSKTVNKYTLPEILKTFVIGVILASLFCLVSGGYRAIVLQDIDELFYIALSRYMHPGYYAMYANFGISVILVYIMHRRNKIIPFPYLLLTYSIVFVNQLSSRTGLIVLTLLMIYGVFYFIFPKLRFKKNLAILVLSIILSIVIIYPLTKYVFKRSETSVATEAANEGSSFGVRVSMWKHSTEIMREHPVFGVGTGDVKDELMANYKKNNIVRAIKNNYNAHNQFVQTAVALGAIGLLSLLAMFLVPLFFAYKEKSLIYFFFVLNVFINFTTESILESQAGVIFIAVMNPLLFFTYKK